MENTGIPRWLELAREIQALAQTGDHYALNDFQHARYKRLLEIAAEMVSQGSTLEVEQVKDAFLSPAGYATPRVDVRGVVFRERKLLLVRERMDGGWTLPGGWADVGDVPSEAAEREVREEAGLVVKARKVLGVYDANRSGSLELFHAFKIVFLCDLLEGVETPSDETSEVGFFAVDEIPSPLSPQRTPARLIQDAFTALANPELATIFD